MPDPATATSGAQHPNPKPAGPRASRAQVRRLVKLGKNFNEAVKAIPPEQQKAYAHEHRAVVQPKNRAQTDEGVLRIRVS